MKPMKILGVVSLAVALVLLAQAWAQNASPVVFVSAKQLQSDIHKSPERMPGLWSIDLAKTSEYSATVARRTRPALAEVHKEMTDIWYVIEGGGTLVTGGSLVENTEPTPGELRGPSVSGGEERKIAKGDILTIPAGVPHWVRTIDGQQIVYLVVKVPSRK
jgi:mannose-6-phosphate isomerase-like protein (cupin superfamily)